MAGDWIKMRVALTYDLKVMQIARTLNGDISFLNDIAPDCQIPAGGCHAQALHTFVIGALHRFWCAAQEVTTDGNLGSLEIHDVDCLVGCSGFCDALIEVGWLESNDDGTLQVHNWTEHNGESAKKRALNQKRMSKHRDEKRSSVAQSSRSSVTREEKRREEKNSSSSAAAAFVLLKPWAEKFVADGRTTKPVQAIVNSLKAKPAEWGCTFVDGIWHPPNDSLETVAEKCKRLFGGGT